MRRISSVAVLVVAALLLVGVIAYAQPASQGRATQQLVIPQGTDVLLAFDQPLSSKTAQVGQQVRLHVANDVVVGDHVIIRAGTPVTAVISRVSHRKGFGVNADIRLVPNPVRSLAGVAIPLQPRTQGSPVGGQKSAQAAGAAVGGAAVLGPIGLAGGYFVKGKPVTVNVGDQFDTEIARNVVLRGSQVARLPRAGTTAAALPMEQQMMQPGEEMGMQANQQMAQLPAGQGYQCVPVTCVPITVAPPAPAPEVTPPPVAAPEVTPPPAETSVAPPAQAECPVPVTAPPAVSTTTCPPPAPVCSACTANVAQTYASGNFCAGFPDLPTAMDHGYSC